MERKQGTLTRWDDDKGYGFICPTNGTKDAFFHVKSLPHYQRRPKNGDVLTYEDKVDEKKRLYASSPKIKGLAWSYFTFIWLCLSLFFVIYVCLVFQRILPFHLLSIYAAMSLLTIWVYSLDKRAAQAGLQRTPEKRLHLLETLGGWPGALLAQIFFRHKIQKLPCQLVFWLIVTGHGIIWFTVLTHQEAYLPYQNAAKGLFQAFNHSNNKETYRLIEKEDDRALSSKTAPVISTRQGTDSHFPKRSIITASTNALIAKGIVKKISPKEGVFISLQTGTEGIIPRSTLVSDFSTRFKQGEHIRVAIHSIADSNKNRIDLILVE
ncbi:MAG: DUF1294 domain-containing protein [Proteobacteria bacterium]|nr:DUF1294 domain-containing protein [Pseudomonadota bacterium]